MKIFSSRFAYIMIALIIGVGIILVVPVSLIFSFKIAIVRPKVIDVNQFMRLRKFEPH